MDDLRYFTLAGNIVHTAWFKTIRRENGNPYLLAVNVLAEIVYWYKPVEVRDEQTGQHIGWRNKYAADLLQKSYEQLASLFGVSKGQVKDAIIRLEELGVIERVFRDIPSKGLYNIMFIKLNVSRLKELSIFDEDKEELNESSPLSENPHPPVQESIPPYGRKDTPLSENPHTNTEITTKNTTEITTIPTYIPTTIETESKQVGYASRADPVINFYKNNFCVEKIPQVIEEQLQAFKSQGMSDELIYSVIQSTVEKGKAWNYAKSTLERLLEQGILNLEQYKTSIIKFRQNHKQENKTHEGITHNGQLKKFNNTYSHNWDFDELERLEREYVERTLNNG